MKKTKIMPVEPFKMPHGLGLPIEIGPRRMAMPWPWDGCVSIALARILSHIQGALP